VPEQNRSEGATCFLTRPRSSCLIEKCLGEYSEDYASVVECGLLPIKEPPLVDREVLRCLLCA
jgi:hypothetical protein